MLWKVMTARLRQGLAGDGAAADPAVEGLHLLVGRDAAGGRAGGGLMLRRGCCDDGYTCRPPPAPTGSKRDRAIRRGRGAAETGKRREGEWARGSEWQSVRGREGGREGVRGGEQQRGV